MKLENLKQIIREMAVAEMARIATGYKLANNWEEALDVLPDSIKNSSRIDRIIRYMKENDITYMKDAAEAIYNNPDTASVNQQFKTLLQAGVIEQTGLASQPKYLTKAPSSGILGRPKISDDAKKMLGRTVAAKYAKGTTNFTEEEKAYIIDLYNSIQ
jgi:hypothetical protein